MALRATKELNEREQERIQNVLDALNQRFLWDLPGVGDVIPVGSIGGHYNIHVTLAGTFFATVLRDDLKQVGIHAVPPGYRIAHEIKNRIWSLHLPEVKITEDSIEAMAHIDRGDPDRDVAGVVTHVCWDFLGGHLRWGHHEADLDPR